MTYLLDTCIISKLQRIKKHPDKKLETWIAKHPPSSFFLSVLTIGEIESGIAKLKDAKKKMHLEDWLYGELIPQFATRIIPINNQVALIWGKLIGEKKKGGISIPAIDSLIVATAQSYNLILVTENVKDFQKMDVKIFNPWN